MDQQLPKTGKPQSIVVNLICVISVLKGKKKRLKTVKKKIAKPKNQKFLSAKTETPI